jgi:hypothetical protein
MEILEIKDTNESKELKQIRKNNLKKKLLSLDFTN